jgi:hypothetical protein
MAPVRNRMTPSKTNPPAQRATRRTSVPRPLRENLHLPNPKVSGESGPQFPPYVCGVCQQILPPPGAGAHVRCPACHRSLHVSTHVRLVCGRCNHTQYVRHTELGAERICAKCSNTLSLDEVVLSPRRHVRRHHHHHRHHSTERADAAGAVLIIGITILIMVLAMTIL